MADATSAICEGIADASIALVFAHVAFVDAVAHILPQRSSDLSVKAARKAFHRLNAMFSLV